jgi:GT2 family glycosyltransferase
MKAANPLVSIIIVNWNGSSLLKECIDSLLAMDYKNIEIVVVDNASTDDSCAVLEQFEDIVVVRNATNAGFGAGNNVGIQRARGKYVATLNNDMTVDPGWLNDPIQHLETDPQTGVVACRQMKYYDKTRIDGLYHIMLKSLVCLPIGIDCVYDETNRLFSEPGYVLSANGGSSIFRKEAFLQVGGFEEFFFGYHEDPDIALRLLHNGWKCFFVPTAVVYHKGSVTFKAKSSVFVYYIERNRILFIYKNWPLRMILRYLPWAVAEELINFKKRVRERGAVREHLRAKWDAFNNLPAFYSQRKAAMQKFYLSRKYVQRLIREYKIPAR